MEDRIQWMINHEGKIVGGGGIGEAYYKLYSAGDKLDFRNINLHNCLLQISFSEFLECNSTCQSSVIP